MSDTSVERAFALLETFERERRPLSLKELALACRVPLSTCHTLVHTLLRRGYLSQTGRRKDLYPTRRLYDLAATILAHDPILQRIEPAMQALREITRETIILGKLQARRVLYLAVLEGPEIIRYSARAGDTKPVHSTCIGKSLLSTLNDADLHAFINAEPLDRVTEATIIDPEAWLADLDEGRRRGCFITRGENVPDVTAVAVPIAFAAAVYGLAVAGPTHRMASREAEICDALTAARDALLE
jgi:DNA-binding IclR family transcriptional regulator